MVRLSDRDDWFELWFEDKKWIIEIMHRNIADDLAAGYNPEGQSIRKAKAELELYSINFDQQVERFKHMEEKEVNRWCFYDMKKRGAIE